MYRFLLAAMLLAAAPTARADLVCHADLGTRPCSTQQVTADVVIRANGTFTLTEFSPDECFGEATTFITEGTIREQLWPHREPYKLIELRGDASYDGPEWQRLHFVKVPADPAQSQFVMVLVRPLWEGDDANVRTIHAMRCEQR
jgi:hypothetical protein